MITRRRLILAAGSAVAAAAVAAFGLWYVVLRTDAPPPVSLEQGIEALESTSGTATATPTAATAQAGQPTVEAAAHDTPDPDQEEGLDGVWFVNLSLDSFAGYRVKEELVGVGFNVAVGRTPTIEGTLVIEGNTIASVEIHVSLRNLKSDKRRRDETLHKNGLEINLYPTASFVLTGPIVVQGVPEPGDIVGQVAQGDLTIHGVTRAVELPLQAQLVDDTIVVVGSTTIFFADYEMETPTGGSVLSVEDHGILEFQVFFSHR